MFSSSSISSDLPFEIQKFIKDHHISIINDAGRAGGGADYVFSFLFKGATADVVVCAVSNLQSDKRFNQEQKDELKSIILNLFEKGDYTVRPDHVEHSPRPGL